MNHAFNFKKIVALLLAVIMMISMCGIAEDSAVEIHDHDHAQLESIMDSVLESIEETEEETSEEPVEETEEETSEEPAEETEEESTEEPAEETEEESTEEPAEENEEESTEEPAEETEEESTEEPAEETEEESTEEPAEENAEETEEETSEEPAEDMDTVVDVPVAMPMMMAVYNVADIECEHLNRVNEVVEWTDYTVDEIEYNDETHDVYGNKIVTYDCVDCGTTGIIEDCGRTYGQMPHDLDNGKCKECEFFTEEGHVCVPVEDNHTSGVLEVVSKGAEGHTVTYQTCIRTYCEHGGAYLTISQEYVTEDPVTEPHVFSNSAIECDRCDYRNECTHENSSTESENTEYAYSDSLGHFVHSYSIEKCNDCGARVEHTAVEVEPHNNDDDECVCGFDGNCDHVDKEEYFEEDYEIYTCKDGLCYRTGPIFKYSGKCSDCGVSLTWISDNYEEKQVEHMLSTSGICFNCGWQDPDVCEHANRYYVCEFMDYDGKFVDNGDGTHSVGAQLLYRAYCPECDTDLGDKWHYSDFDADYVEEHHWNRDSETLLSKCICGAKSDEFCDHAETYEVIEYDYDDEVDKPCATPNGATGHISSVSGTKMISKFCRECFALVGEEEIIPFNTAEEQAHRFTEDWLYEENYCTYCTECHYVCTHDNATFEPNGFYIRERVELNNDRHVLIVSDYLRGDCPDCGRYVEKISDDEDEVNESHVWENDICNVCNWKLNCAHENASSYTELVPDWENPVVISKNDEGHELECVEMIITDCDDCGMHAEEETGATGTKVFGHGWNEDGKCDLCGWENTCTHENGTETFPEIHDGNTESVNATQHRITGRKVEITTCNDCGQALSIVEIDPDYDVLEAHVIDEEGHCQECGYESDCDHSELEASEYELENIHDYRHEESVDQHYVTGEFRGYAFCEECGLKVDVGLEEREEPEDHSFDWHHGGDWHVWLDESGKPEAEAIDGDIHNVKMVWKNAFECSMCNLWADIPTEEYEVQEHGHDWESGVCVTCGYEPDCDHAGAVDVWEEFERYEHGALEDGHPDRAILHYEKGNEYKYTRCTICNAIIDKELINEAVVNYDNHIFNVHGTCNFCDYQSECTVDHETLDYSEPRTELLECWYIGSEKVHHARYEDIYEATCPECEMTFEYERQEWETDEEPHVKEGDPVDSYFVYASEDEDFVIDCNADEHTVKLVWIDEYSCPMCNGGLFVYDNSKTETEIQHHQWDENGVCEICGYENACEHGDTVVEREEREHSRVPVAGGKQHKITYDIVDVTYCNICWQNVGEEPVEVNSTKLENHQLDENGWCSCNFLSECDHSNLPYEPIEGAIHRIDCIDDEIHEVEYDEIMVAICPECGLEVVASCETKVKQVAHVKSELWEEGWHHAYEHADFLLDYDEYEHTVKYVMKQVWWCEDCGQPFLCETEEWEYVTEGHGFNTEGACHACPYINPCEHANDVESLVEFWEHGMEQVDDKQHVRIGNKVRIERCNECWQNLVEEVIEENAEVFENHEFDAENVCRHCGYETDCDHSNLEYAPVIEDYQVWHESDEGHRVVYIQAQVAECSACGMKVYKSREEVDELLPHAVTEVLYGDWDSYHGVEDEDFLKYVDEEVHTIKQYEWAEIYCEVCDCNYWGYSGETRYDTWNHEWQPDGTCHWCGYVNTCKHDGGVEYFEEFYDHTMTAQDEKQHVYMGELVREARCIYCWQVLESTVLEEEHKVFEDHDVTQENFCGHCGYEFDCDHSAIQLTEKHLENEWFEAIDEDAHVHFTEYRMRGLCDKCDLYVYGEYFVEEKEEKHNLDLENLNKYIEQADPFVTEIGKNSHTIRYIEYTGAFCMDCGMYTEKPFEQGETILVEQHYYENGKCMVCGYANTCEHKNTVTVESFNANDCVSVDGKEHVFKGNICKETWCDDCYSLIASEVLKAHEEKAVHELDRNGACIDCDFIVICDHGELELPNKNEFIMAFYLEDEKTHYYEVWCYSTGECSVCGFTVQGDGYVEGRYADHEFDQNGKCVDCGYVKPAADPTPKPTAKPTVKPTAKPTATPAPSVEPTEEVIVEPTPEVSVEPSVEPTVECVVEPGTRMAEALVTVMDHKTTSEDENVVVEVKIVNSEILMDEEQHETFETLSSVDQMMVLMKVLQYDGEADYAENNLDVEMSEEAQALVETILESFNAMEEEEKVQYMAVLAEAFPTSEVEIDGEIREAVVIVLEVKVDDVVTYEQYTFLRDVETGSWLFYSVELVEKPEDFDASEVAALPESEQAEVAEAAEVQG